MNKNELTHVEGTPALVTEFALRCGVAVTVAQPSKADRLAVTIAAEGDHIEALCRSIYDEARASGSGTLRWGYVGPMQIACCAQLAGAKALVAQLRADGHEVVVDGHNEHYASFRTSASPAQLDRAAVLSGGSIRSMAPIQRWGYR